MSNKQAF